MSFGALKMLLGLAWGRAPTCLLTKASAAIVPTRTLTITPKTIGLTTVTNTVRHSIITNIDIVVSPVVLTELLECIDPEEPNIDETMKIYVQDIIDRARMFVERFRHTIFFHTEGIHEFRGLEFQNPETGEVTNFVDYRLIMGVNAIGIFSVNEVPIDEMYDVRLVIAESQFPEYQ